MQISTSRCVQRLLRALRHIYPRVKTTLLFSNPWELLVATILSAQTTDIKVNEVTRMVFTRYRTVRMVADADSASFAKIIRHVNYHRTKARHIVHAARIIEKRYHGVVPLDMQTLIMIPGVGRKTANVVINELSHRSFGIAVDTHVARLSRLFGLSTHIRPERIEQDLMRQIPKSQWRSFSLRCIAYGRTYCSARPHDHAHCPLRAFYPPAQLKRLLRRSRQGG